MDAISAPVSSKICWILFRGIIGTNIYIQNTFQRDYSTSIKSSNTYEGYFLEGNIFWILFRVMQTEAMLEVPGAVRQVQNKLGGVMFLFFNFLFVYLILFLCGLFFCFFGFLRLFVWTQLEQIGKCLFE